MSVYLYLYQIVQRDLFDPVRCSVAIITGGGVKAETRVNRVTHSTHLSIAMLPYTAMRLRLSLGDSSARIIRQLTELSDLVNACGELCGVISRASCLVSRRRGMET